MRRMALPAACLSLIALAATASAAALPFGTTPHLTGSITPKKLRAGHWTNVALHLELGYAATPASLQPLTASKISILFPGGARTNGAKFPSCAHPAVGHPCPRGSRIGSGTILADAGTPGKAPSIVQHQKVVLYNGPKGKSIHLYLDGGNPVSIFEDVPMKLERMSGLPWSYRLTAEIPKNLQNYIGFQIAVRSLKTTVSAVTGAKHLGFVQAIACPPGGHAPLQAGFTFNDPTGLPAPGLLATATAQIACSS